MTRQFEDKQHRRAEDHDGHTCAYEASRQAAADGLRCKYAGSHSRGILGGGPWYCSVHNREGGTAFAWQCLEQSQSYRAPVVEENLTWLDKNFPMRPGESRGEYNQRCRAYALSMLGTFRPKSVVGYGEPVRMREPGEDGVS